MPNMFVVREIPERYLSGAWEPDDDSSLPDYYFSDSMTSVAEARGWWQRGDPFDFTAIYSYGEYENKYYSGRRIWRALNLFAPSLNLAAEYDDPLRVRAAYPMSVKPDELVGVRDVMAMHRDTYAGTPFDLAADGDLAGGAWGLPFRFDPELAYDGAVPGAWERPIGSFRTTYTVINQARSAAAGGGQGNVGGVVYFAPHCSPGSAFIPLFAAALAAGDAANLPSHSFASDPRKHDAASAFWAHRFATNVAFARWRDMSKDIGALQTKWEDAGESLVRRLDAEATASLSSSSSPLTASPSVGRAGPVLCAGLGP